MHHGVGYDCFLNHKLMRLYIRPGLSARVVAALQNRLRQAMSDGNGAHASASPVRGGDQEERARSRSRARGEGVTEANAPEEPHQEEKEDGGDAPGTPGAAKKLGSRQELMKEIVACTKTLASATEDVSLAIDEMKEAKRQMSDGFKLLAEKMEDTCKAVVTMGASVTHQSAEITRMLRAFDKHAGVVKWALKTNAPLEQSILGISTDVTAKMEKLEGRVGLAFENVSKGIVQLIEAIQNPPGAPSVLQSGQFPPARRPICEKCSKWYADGFRRPKYADGFGSNSNGTTVIYTYTNDSGWNWRPIRNSSAADGGSSAVHVHRLHAAQLRRTDAADVLASQHSHTPQRGGDGDT